MKRAERDQLSALLSELMQQQTKFAHEFPATDTLLLGDAPNKLGAMALQTILQMDTTQRIYVALRDAEIEE